MLPAINMLLAISKSREFILDLQMNQECLECHIIGERMT